MPIQVKYPGVVYDPTPGAQTYKPAPGDEGKPVALKPQPRDFVNQFSATTKIEGDTLTFNYHDPRNKPVASVDFHSKDTPKVSIPKGDTTGYYDPTTYKVDKKTGGWYGAMDASDNPPTRQFPQPMLGGQPLKFPPAALDQPPREK